MGARGTMTGDAHPQCARTDREAHAVCTHAARGIRCMNVQARPAVASRPACAATRTARSSRDERCCAHLSRRPDGVPARPRAGVRAHEGDLPHARRRRRRAARQPARPHRAAARPRAAAPHRQCRHRADGRTRRWSVLPRWVSARAGDGPRHGLRDRLHEGARQAAGRLDGGPARLSRPRARITSRRPSARRCAGRRRGRRAGPPASRAIPTASWSTPRDACRTRWRISASRSREARCSQTPTGKSHSPRRSHRLPQG